MQASQPLRSAQPARRQDQDTRSNAAASLKAKAFTPEQAEGTTLVACPPATQGAFAAHAYERGYSAAPSTPA